MATRVKSMRSKPHPAASDITERKQAEDALRESEQKYRTILEDIEDGYYEVDTAGNFTFFNDPMCRIIGYSKDEMMGMNNRQYMDKENAKKVYQAFNRVHTTAKHTKEFGWEIIRKDGTKRFIEASVSLKRNSEGEPIGFGGIVRDITDRKRAEEALRESEKRYRMVAENITDVISCTDMNLRPTYMSPSVTRLLGYSVEEALNRTVEESLTPASREAATESLARQMAVERDGKREHLRLPAVELQFYRKDGSTVWVEAAVSLRRDSEGNPIEILTVLRDVTERKRAEEVLRHSEEYFRSLTENISDVILVLGSDGTVRYQSPSFKRMLGEGRGGKDVFELVHPDDMANATETFAELMQDPGATIHRETRGQHRDGSWRTFEVVGRNLLDNPSVGGIVVTWRDITERKQAEEELRVSEAKYRELVENINDIIYAVDENGLVTYVSPALESILGYSPDELMGQSFADKIHREDLQTATEGFLSTLSGNSTTGNYRLLTKSGETRWMRSANRPIFEGNRVAGAAGLLTDITERKQAEEALRRSEEYFRSLTENISDIVMVLGSDGTIHYQSPSFKRMLGEHRSGKKLLEFVHHDDMANAAEAFAYLMQNPGATVHREVRAQDRDGSWRVFEGTGRNLLHDPKVNGIVVSYRDITDRKQAEEEVRSLNEELEQRVIERTTQLEAVNKELEAFAYSVSHDLRAPLRSIDGFSQVLLEDYAGKLDEEGKDYLQRVRSASQRMAELIDDILNLSRMTRSEMQRETVDLSALAQTIATELQQSQPERVVEFIITPGLVVTGDAHLLRVVLGNLLDNAWKFTKGQPRARIEFGYAETNGQSAYFMRDNGVGFDMAYADKLFGAFQRLHSKNEFEGSGIGLATVQRIIHRHGGDIWAESAVNQGATFYFTL